MDTLRTTIAALVAVTVFAVYGASVALFNIALHEMFCDFTGLRYKQFLFGIDEQECVVAVSFLMGFVFPLYIMYLREERSYPTTLDDHLMNTDKH